MPQFRRTRAFVFLSFLALTFLKELVPLAGRDFRISARLTF